MAHASPDRTTQLGVMADVGLPDGAIASAVYRPVQLVQLHVGAGYNLISNGVRGGITLAPLGTTLTPTLSVDYGRYFPGDANEVARMLRVDPGAGVVALERVGYDFANAHVGLQLGGTRARFFLQGGVTRVTSDLDGLDASDASADDGGSVTVGASHVTLWSVSGRLGLILFLH